MFVQHVFIGTFLESRHHERTVCKGTVANDVLHWAEVFFGLLFQRCCIADSIVMSGASIASQTVANLFVEVANDQFSQRVAIFSAGIIRGIFRIRFKCQPKQSSVCDSNTVWKSKFFLCQTGKHLSFLFVGPKQKPVSQRTNCFDESLAKDSRSSFANFKRVSLIWIVCTTSFCSHALEKHHQLVDDWCLWTTALAFKFLEDGMIFDQIQHKIKTLAGHAVFLKKFFVFQPRQCCGFHFNVFGFFVIFFIWV